MDCIDVGDTDELGLVDVVCEADKVFDVDFVSARDGVVDTRGVRVDVSGDKD